MQKYTICLNCNNTGENVLVCHPSSITAHQLEKALAVRGFFMVDCVTVTPEDLQHYIIDDRLTLSASMVAQIEKLTA